MAFVRLTGAELALMPDLPASVIRFADMPQSRSVAAKAQTRVGHYAGGVVRVTRTPSALRVVRYANAVATVQQMSALDAWMGEPVVYRDEMSNLDIGVLDELTGGQTSESPVEAATASYVRVSFSIIVTTHTAEAFL